MKKRSECLFSILTRSSVSLAGLVTSILASLLACFAVKSWADWPKLLPSVLVLPIVFLLYEYWSMRALRRLAHTDNFRGSLLNLKHGTESAIRNKVRVRLYIPAAKGTLRLSAAVNADDTFAETGNIYLRTYATAVGDALRTLRPVVIRDVRSESKPDEYFNIVTPSSTIYRSFLCVPIKREGKVVGILSFDSQEPIKEADVEPLLKTVQKTVEEEEPLENFAKIASRMEE